QLLPPSAHVPNEASYTKISCEREYECFKIFTSAVSEIQKASDGRVDLDELVQAGIRGMLKQLDSHTVLLKRDSYGGQLSVVPGDVGLRIRLEENRVSVFPFPASPSENAGIRSGDYLLKIENESITGLPATDILKKLRGPSGSKVLL